MLKISIQNKLKLRLLRIVFVVFLISLFVVPANLIFADTFNKQINYQGKLTNSSGIAVTNGDYNLEFKIYNSAGTTLWTETRTGSDRVTVTSGLFSLMLGEVTPITTIDWNQTLYLGVNVGGSGLVPIWDGEMLPRKVLGSVPSAFQADKLDNLDSTQFVRTDATSTIAVSGTDTALIVNQSGAGNLVDFQASGTSVFSVSIAGLASTSALKVSNNATVDGLLSVNGIGTSTFADDLSVVGNLAVTGASNFFNPLTAPNFIATSTLVASTFPYASTTALTVSGTASTSALIVSNGATVRTLTSTSLISANNITVSGGITLGGVFMSTWPAGGSGAGSYWATSTDSLVGYPSLAGDYAIVIGGGATTTDNVKFEVIGNSAFTGQLSALSSLSVGTSNTDVTLVEGDLWADKLLLSATSSIYASGEDLIFEDGNAGVKTLSQLLMGTTDCTQSNAVLSGGLVTYSGAGLVYDIPATTYCLGGLQYNISSSQKTLTDADATGDRIDVIAVNNSGEVVVITGATSTNPIAPSVDPSSQLDLTFVYVKAGATMPGENGTGPLIETIYDENTAIEWSGIQSTPVGEVDFDNTTDPQNGSKNMEVTTALGRTSATDIFRFSTSTAFWNPQGFMVLSFYIKNKVAWTSNNDYLRINFQTNLGAQIGNRISLRNGLYGFDKDNTTTYQKISIPLSDFGNISTAVKYLAFTAYPANTTNRLDFRIDRITAEGASASASSTPTWLNGTGSVGQVSFWTGSLSLAGSSKLFWDNTLSRLGIGTSSPMAALSVVGQTLSEYFTATSTTQASTFPYASTTALTVSGTASTTALIVSGQTTLASNLTGTLQAVGGVVSASSTLSVAYGGTGVNTFTPNGILYGNGTSAIGMTAAGTNNYLLYSNNGTPAWTNAPTILGTNITGLSADNISAGTLSVARGGTGQTSFGQGWLSSDGTTITSSTSPTVAYLTATSTTQASTFPYASTTALTVSGTGYLGNFIANNASATSTIAGGLAIETSGFVYDYSTDNVGIGTASPLTKLEISGTGGLKVGGFGLDTSTTYNSFYVNGYTDTAGVPKFTTTGSLYAWQKNGANGELTLFAGTGTANNQIYFSSLNKAISVNSSGNVGIGTTSPTALLEIGSAHTSNSGHGLVIGRVGAAADSLLGFNSQSYDWSVGVDNSENAFIVSNIVSSNPLGTNPLLVIKDSGNVGIGTTSPYARLSVVGQAVAEYFTATSTTQASTFPYASTTALTVSGSTYLGTLTGPLQAQNGLVSASSTIRAVYGGTGFSSYTVGDLLYANTTSSLGKLSDVATGYVLLSGGENTAPSWGKVGLATHVSGTLAVANGGTGQTSFGQGWLSSDGTTITSSTSPTVAYLTATSTTATSTFAGGLAIETSGFVYDYSSNNVGIGTAAPASLLHISGTSGLLARIQATGGSPELRLAPSSGTYWDLMAASTRFDIQGSDSPLLSILSGGNVGIGTTSPTALLEVAGTSFSTPLLTVSGAGGGNNSGILGLNRMSEGRVSAIQLMTKGVVNWNVGIAYRNGAPEAGFSIGSDYNASSSKLYIKTTGEVGVGTSSPFSTLSVAGNSYLGGDLTATGTLKVSNNIYLGDGSASDNDSLYFDQGGQSLSWDNSQSIFGLSSTLSISGSLLATDFAKIGSMSGTYSSKLQSSDGLDVEDGYNGYRLFTAYGDLDGYNGNGDALISLGDVDLSGSNSSGGAAGVLSISPTLNKAFLLNSSFGIGTDTPRASGLHIYGGASGFTNFSANADDLIIEGTTAVGMTFKSANNGVQYIYFSDGGSVADGSISYNQPAQRMDFGTAASGVAKLSITSTGNIGMGTSTPNNMLDIYSTTKSAIGFTGASGSTYKWTMGMDVSNGGRFAIASSTALGTLDRLVIDGNGNVGLSSSTPSARLSILGANSSVNGVPAPLAIHAVGGAGYNGASAGQNGTAGGGYLFVGGNGGNPYVSTMGGVGGSFSVLTGAGGFSTGGVGGAGGAISLVTGRGGYSGSSPGAAGGDISILTGDGGGTSSNTSAGGRGGNFTITLGNGAVGYNSHGIGGSFTLTAGTGSSEGGDNGIDAAAGGGITITSGAGGAGGGGFPGAGGNISIIGGNAGLDTFEYGYTNSGGALILQAGHNGYGTATSSITLQANKGSVGIGTSTPLATHSLEVRGQAASGVDNFTIYATANGPATEALNVEGHFGRHYTNAGAVASVDIVTGVEGVVYDGAGTNSIGNTGIKLFGIMGNYSSNTTSDTSVFASIYGEASEGTSAGGTITTFNPTGNGGVNAAVPVYAGYFKGNVYSTLDVCNGDGYCLSDYSDERLKTDVTDIDNTLDKIMQLRAVTYQWNDNYYKLHPWEKDLTPQTNLGFIAQEVDLIFPEIIKGRDSEYMGLDYDRFTVVIVKAIQELVAKFDAVVEKVVDGIAYLKDVAVASLIVGSPEKPVGITIYDQTTGEPYCLVMKAGEMTSLPGDCKSINQDNVEEENNETVGGNSGENTEPPIEATTTEPIITESEGGEENDSVGGDAGETIEEETIVENTENPENTNPIVEENPAENAPIENTTETVASDSSESENPETVTEPEPSPEPPTDSGEEVSTTPVN